MSTIWIRRRSADHTFIDLDDVQRFVDAIFIQYRDSLRCPSCGSKGVLTKDQTGGGARGGRRFRRYKHKCEHLASGRTFTIGMADMLMTLLAPIFQKTASQTTNQRRKEALSVLNVMAVALQRMQDLGQRVDSTTFQARLERLREIDEQLEAALQAGLLEQDARMRQEGTRSPSPTLEAEHSHGVVDGAAQVVEVSSATLASVPADVHIDSQALPSNAPSDVSVPTWADIGRLSRSSPDAEATNVSSPPSGNSGDPDSARADPTSSDVLPDHMGAPTPVPVSSSLPALDAMTPQLATPQVRHFREQCVGTEPISSSTATSSPASSQQICIPHTYSVIDGTARERTQARRRTQSHRSNATGIADARPYPHRASGAECGATVVVQTGRGQQKRQRKDTLPSANATRKRTNVVASGGATSVRGPAQDCSNVRNHISLEERAAPVNSVCCLQSRSDRSREAVIGQSDLNAANARLSSAIRRSLNGQVPVDLTSVSVAYLNVCGLTEQKWEVLFRAFAEMDRPEQAGLLILSETRRPGPLTETLLNNYSRWIRAMTPAPERTLTQDRQAASSEEARPNRPGGGMQLLCHPALSPYVTILSITPYSCTFSISILKDKDMSHPTAWNVHAVYLPPSMGRLQEYSVFKSFLCPPGRLKPDLLLGDLNVRFGTEGGTADESFKGPLGRLSVVEECLEDLQLVKLAPKSVRNPSRGSLFQDQTFSRVDHAFVRRAPMAEENNRLHAALTFRVAPIDTDHPLMRVRVRRASTADPTELPGASAER